MKSQKKIRSLVRKYVGQHHWDTRWPQDTKKTHYERVFCMNQYSKIHLGCQWMMNQLQPGWWMQQGMRSRWPRIAKIFQIMNSENPLSEPLRFNFFSDRSFILEFLFSFDSMIRAKATKSDFSGLRISPKIQDGVYLDAFLTQTTETRASKGTRRDTNYMGRWSKNSHMYQTNFTE